MVWLVVRSAFWSFDGVVHMVLSRCGSRSVFVGCLDVVRALYSWAVRFCARALGVFGLSMGRVKGSTSFVVHFLFFFFLSFFFFFFFSLFFFFLLLLLLPRFCLLSFSHCHSMVRLFTLVWRSPYRVFFWDVTLWSRLETLGLSCFGTHSFLLEADGKRVSGYRERAAKELSSAFHCVGM